MNDEQRDEPLIDHLVRDLQPVRRLPPPLHQTALWSLATAGYAFAVLAALGVRPDVAAVSTAPSFLVACAALLLLAVTAASWAFGHAVPGATVRASRILSVFGALAWCSSVIAHASMDGGAAAGWNCVARMVALGGVPALAGAALVRRAHPLNPRAPYILAIVAAGAAAMAGTQLACPRDGLDHVLLWHAGPVLVAALVRSLGACM